MQPPALLQLQPTEALSGDMICFKQYAPAELEPPQAEPACFKFSPTLLTKLLIKVENVPGPANIKALP